MYNNEWNCLCCRKDTKITVKIKLLLNKRKKW